MHPGPVTTVEPATLEHLDALLVGGDAFEARFGLRVVPGYLAFPEALQPARRGLIEGIPPEWSSYLIIDPVARELVGFGGFKGPPRDGEVEIGYSIAPERQGRGHATSAARQLIQRARAAGVAVVSAHTLPEANASTRVLERCGMARAGETSDPQEGPVWRWEIRLS